MGFFDRFRQRTGPNGALGSLLPSSWGSVELSLGDQRKLSEYLNGEGNPGGLVSVSKLSEAQMWESQPHLRTVVSFLARNVAHVGVHTFERQVDADGNDSRVRDRTSPAALVMAAPNEQTTTYELWYGLVMDRALYDRAYWAIVADAERPDGAGWSIYRLPPTWVKPIKADHWHRKHYEVKSPGQVEPTIFQPEEILEWPGYDPEAVIGSVSPIEALKNILGEQVQASLYRQQVWRNGGRVSAVLSRPAGAPSWSPEARERFRSSWRTRYTGNGEATGGTPILEDGMTLEKMDFSAKEQEYVEGTKLSFATVCSVYHVNPTMVGMLDNANYSNVREFRRGLYGDTLGPWFADAEARTNQMLLPRLGASSAERYYEFNIAEKLQGSFEEQAAVMQTMVGVPIMTRNEGRGKFNLPAVEGGDELITPLNVTSPGGSTSGQAAPPAEPDVPPADDGTPAAASSPRLRLVSGTVSLKGAPTSGQLTKAQERVSSFFSRQEKAVRSKLGIKAKADWWDAERWNRELSDDLMGLAQLVADDIGQATAVKLGFSADDYDPDRTMAFLRAVADRIAGKVNDTTEAQIKEALDAEDPAAALSTVWAEAQGQRTALLAAGLAATAAGFGTVEAAHQLVGEGDVTKTWVTGPRARKSHARMNGETVGIDEAFSNGAQWPADIALGVDEVAGCNCSVTVNVAN